MFCDTWRLFFPVFFTECMSGRLLAEREENSHYSYSFTILVTYVILPHLYLLSGWICLHAVSVIIIP